VRGRWGKELAAFNTEVIILHVSTKRCDEAYVF